jgi:hypothetical protein
MRPLAGLALLCATAFALEVPVGPTPDVDGVVGEQEWEGALAIRRADGTARLRLAGQALCLSLEMSVPYSGERVDLHLSDFDGRDYVWHAFHPAAFLPEYPFFPIAPVVARRSSWALRQNAPPMAPRSCLFRARVHRSESRWSMEAAIALDALDIRPEIRHVFRLEVVSAASAEAAADFTPRQEGSTDTRGWEALRGKWPETGEPFRTAEEDDRRGFEFGLFYEQVPRAAHEAERETPLGDAVGGRKNNARIAALIDRLDACAKADPGDLFARSIRAQVLRRSNRLDEAASALDAIATEFPYSERSLALLTERCHLLFALGRFAEAAAAAKAIGLPAIEEAATKSAAAWEEELRTREAEKSRLPRAEFRTAKGTFVAELLAGEAAPVAEALRKRISAGEFDGGSIPLAVGGGMLLLRASKGREPVRGTAARRSLWRGTLALDPSTGDVCLLLTRAFELEGKVSPVGRVVEGMDVADALEAEDRVERVRLLP